MNAPQHPPDTKHQDPGAPPNGPPPRTSGMRVAWRQSLLVRAAFLCFVLFACLLGSVIVLTQFYFREVALEMEEQTSRIMQLVQVELAATPQIEYERLASDLMEHNEGFDIELEPVIGEAGQAEFTHEFNAQGEYTRVIRVPLRIEGREILLTIRAVIVPQAEILRAFQNRYMMALTAVFLVALALLLYLIAKTLRPLTQLSETCAAISSGELRPMKTKNASGEILALEQTFNDMVASLREKELVEAKLRQAQRLSALGNLAAGVAHDVRNPLNAIKLLSSHALDSLDGGSQPAAKSLGTIRKEVDRLEEIVSRFLSLAREGALEATPQRVDSLLESCLQLIRKDAEERGIDLTWDLRAGETTLMLDSKQITRAILNVLVNAMEVSGPGGRVRLVSRVTTQACEVEIRDNGPGLSKEAAERIFEPYYTTKPGGTGLGLSITRGIVEEHGGAIEVYSLEGQGCLFMFSFPFETTKAA